jgi:MYXO-CTERM domain-containing protein
VPPAITITGPTLLDVWDASSSPLLLTMAVLDNVGVASVTFFNAATGGDGVGTPVVADTWTASVALALGANPITVTVRDPAGNTATDALVVNFIPGPGDSSNPVVTITSHPTGTTLDWASSVIDLAGIASDNVQIATVIWSNAANARSGSADGTDAWTTTLLLVPGINVITMRTYDTSGNTDTDQITILYTPPPLPPEHIPGGHCGLLGLEVLALIALRRRRRK